MRSEFGTALKVAVEGGSHEDFVSGEMIGLPSDIEIDMHKLTAFMQRRRGGTSPFTTPRAEDDVPELESGFKLLGGKYLTDGSPIKFKIANRNRRSGDYSQFSDTPRPSHADYTARLRYGDSVDLRGGGHFSARLTAPLCVMGAMCMQYLSTLGVSIGSHLYSVGNVRDKAFDAVNCRENDLTQAISSPFPTLDGDAGERMKAELEKTVKAHDSLGGIVECAALGVPSGIGDPLFYGIENRISQAIFGLGGVRGIEFGTGFDAAKMRGSEHNDPFFTDGVTVKTLTNHCGGIQAGITNGMPIIFRVAFKPTASISAKQATVSLSEMTNKELIIGGRHDPCIAIRALPCVEAVCAITLADAVITKENGV